jgi:hypothetical protein
VNTKFFDDEIRDFDKIKEDNLAIILNHDDSNKNFIDFKDNDKGKNTKALNSYLREKIGDDCDKLRPAFDFNYINSCWIIKYTFNKIIDINDSLINTIKIDNNSRNSFGIGTDTIPNLSQCENLEKLELTSGRTKSIYSLPENVQLRNLSLTADTDSLLRIAEKKKAVFENAETVSLYNLRTTEIETDKRISIGDFKSYIGDNTKNFKMNNFNIKESEFISKENIEHICIDALTKTDITFDLDKMPNLKSVILTNVTPKFKITKQHSNLKYIQINSANVTTIDGMFEVNAEITEPLIQPTFIQLDSNFLESTDSKIVDFNTVKVISVDGNLLTDDTFNITDSMQVVSAKYNILSDLKIDEIKNIGEKE